MCIGVSTSPQKHQPLFLAKPPPPHPPPLNRQIVQAPPPHFLGNRGDFLYWLFMNLPPKVGFFSEPPKYWSFSSLIPSYLLKVTEFLVKISQFKFLAMTEKNNFAYKLSCHYIFQILIYFVCKNCTPPEKITTLFPSNPL